MLYANKYTQTQGFHSGHKALDLVPLDEKGNKFLAPIYPLFDGSTIFALDDDPIRGKGVRTSSKLPFIWVEYLKEMNIIPKDYKEQVYIECLYWHLDDVYPESQDGYVDTQTPIGITGNTGQVYSGGVPVPDEEKGKPPYKGLHLHIETFIVDKNRKAINTTWDNLGRIDPNYFLKKTMTTAKLIKIGNEYGFWVPATHPEGLSSMGLGHNYPLPKHDNGQIDFSLLKADYTI